MFKIMTVFSTAKTRYLLDQAVEQYYQVLMSEKHGEV